MRTVFLVYVGIYEDPLKLLTFPALLKYKEYSLI